MKRFFLKNAIVAASIPAVLLIGASFSAASAQTQPRQLSRAERVAYQYAIEEVYWRHRIWPKENPGSKPALDEVMSAALIEKKVENYLRKSQLLASYWQRPITREQLEAEMNRMASHTKQPEVLRELFAALGDDPFVISECLAGPVLAERLAESFRTESKPVEEIQGRATGSFDLTQDDSDANSTTASYKFPEISVPVDCPDDSWTGTSNFPPVERYYHTAVWTGSEMIIWGGEPEFYSNSGGRYNPTTDSWNATSTSNAPLGRENHTAVWSGSEMIIWGGTPYTNSGGRYNPTTDSWTATNISNAPLGRENHTAVWSGNEMIVWGGIDGSFPRNYLNTGGRYNPSTDSWVATNTIVAPAGRFLHTAVWTGSQMVIWGGGNASELNTGGRYNPSSDSWTATSTSNAAAARYSHTAVWTGSQMIVWGGYSGSVLNSGGRYDPSSDSWAATSNANAPTARDYHTAVWTGSQMIVWGGYDAISAGYSNTGGRYNPTTDTWTATSLTNAPLGRWWHTAVWSGNQMVVWGGNGSGSYLDTGGRYNPTTDTWTATTLYAPEGRNRHTAVWTGSEMIIWGGYKGTTPFDLNTGAKYNPATDNWTPTSMTNVPSGRENHTGLWTGSEMIVWGGYAGGLGFRNTGGRYNPSSDSWTATSTINAPAARDYHTAVWIGGEMIVWGGYGSGLGHSNTGGRYNPGTDSWTATSTTNAPAGREYHTAVWTGAEMIVWGGYNSSTYFNTGGRYNPSTNSWATSSTTNAPAAREFHTAVWTGSQMIIWGGDNGFDFYFNTGGRYDPGTDSWTSTSITSAPAPRYAHTALWTGSEMIVWGGYNGSSYFNTGGRYNPSIDSWTATATTGAPAGRYRHTAVWTGSQMVVWGGYGNGDLNSGGRYCDQSVAPVAQAAVSRKSHGLSGTFDLDLPLSGMAGVECRAGGETNDYSIAVTFASAVTVNGSPQAQIISGTGTIGSFGVYNGGMVTISGNSVTVPLTNVANAQTINVRLNGVTGSSGSGNITIPMSLLVGDTNANGAVNSADVAQAKARLGQSLDATNFRSDVNANGAINAGDVSQIKSLLGTGLP